MSVISPSNNMEFRDSSIMISNVKRFLESFNAFNLLNEEEFYRHISTVLNQLGSEVMREEEAFVKIESSRGLLPPNFKRLYAAYKTTPFFTHAPTKHQQSNGISMSTDITHEIISKLNRCSIECCESQTQILEKLEIKNFVTDSGYINFRTPILLSLSPNVKRDVLADACQNLNGGSSYEITISGRYIYTNFDNDVLYLKYFGFPKDLDTGLPMIPNVESVEKAIEWYIIYQTLLALWFNSTIPDIQIKMGKAEEQYKFWFAQALWESKSPSWEAMINKVKRNKKNLSIYQM